MKKMKRFSGLGMFTAVCLSMAMLTGCSDVPQEMAAEIQETQDVQESANISTEEKAVEYVIIGGEEYPVDITKLELSCQWLTGKDLWQLSKMTELTELSICDYNINDISLLSGLVKLNELYIMDNSLSDISPLSGLTKLTLLAADIREVTDTNPMLKLSELSELYIAIDEAVDLGFLYDIENLEKLYLSKDSDMSEEEMQQLQNALPDCLIHLNFQGFIY